MINGAGIPPFVSDIGVVANRRVRVVDGKREIQMSLSIEDMGDLRTQGALRYIDATGMTAVPVADDTLAEGKVVDLPEWKTKMTHTIGVGQPARLALLKPETYMNVSGQSVGAAARFFKVPPDTLLVVHDDVDLEPGRFQIRLGGGLAGHNGLRSIASTLGTQEFLRLRIGVGRPGRGDRRPVADYVLSEFEPEIDVEALVSRAADAVEAIAREGLEEAQQRFN